MGIPWFLSETVADTLKTPQRSVRTGNAMRNGAPCSPR